VAIHISHLVNEYVNLQAEEEKIKKKSRRAWALTWVSFVVGLMSFYITLTGPTAEEIAQQLIEIGVVDETEN
jgi:hypothetical protein|tara:strand:+ start:1506 stop:1721 length:216 start_codon:yes stop_codon:yes gene_type:complete